MDLCIEIHRRLTPTEAITLAKGIEQYHPLFYEDPILPDNFDAMGLVAERISIPIATGERFHSIHEFDMLLKRGAVQYVRPDVCLAGGISHSKKIAALAEANYVNVVPHNPLSPVSTAACIQLAACIPNFAIQELPNGENIPPKSVLENMSHVEKMVLYETKKINMFETFSDSEIGAMSMRGRIILLKGLAISYTPFILSLLANKSNQEVVYFAMLGNYITLGVLIHDIHKQKELYNDKLYKKIFLND